MTAELTKGQDVVKFDWFDDPSGFTESVFILRSRSGLQRCFEEVMNRVGARAYWKHLIERGYRISDCS